MKQSALKIGMEGRKDFRVDVRLTASRFEKQTLRARPGTFEWRYARKRADAALYHGGNHFANLWEQAGIASARGVNLSGAGGGAGWNGLPDSRVAAIDELNRAYAVLGQAPSARLIAYCAEGQTAGEIARKHGTKERAMAPVLHEDLRACALHFKYLGKPR